MGFPAFLQTGNPNPGESWLWQRSGHKKIVNLLTQEPSSGHGGHPGRATLSHVNHSLKELAKIARKEKFTSLALPRLATGVGKLNWEDVKPLIENHLGDLGIPVPDLQIFVPSLLTARPSPLKCKRRLRDARTAFICSIFLP
jgi:O-acetyl-ADP-ribose deacetylase (regulator of RNase III)